ncbi:MAG: aldolase/citrate lyase family protein [Proteobacteria bacterium]|nr:aldolase/citrate lyase family protein [Pseudomonadota bacterium]
MPRNAFSRHAALKERIRTGVLTLGTFVKTTAAPTVEIVVASGVDFVALDAEHAPWGLDALDTCIMAARVCGVPVLVRISDIGSREVLQVLDMGAAGIIVPHICSTKDAEDAVSATRYRGGVRGFSPSGRSGGYGAIPAAEYRELSDNSVIVIGQTEDALAAENADTIAAVHGLDALFIGRADLSVSLGVDDIANPAVDEAVGKICAAGRGAGKTVGIFMPSPAEAARFQQLGVSLFIIGTDQSMLKTAARSMTNGFRSAMES